LDDYVVVVSRFPRVENEIISKVLSKDDAIKFAKEYNEDIKFFWNKARVHEVSFILSQINRGS
jgi:hypothetical protein